MFISPTPAIQSSLGFGAGAIDCSITRTYSCF
jgi:hypothetical protein